MRFRLSLLAFLLLAAFLRLYGLVTISPPGPAHDEVANWLIDRAILAGKHGVYFTEAYGHEAGFHYWQTLFVALVGDNLLGLRLPAAMLGLLGVCVTYVLLKSIFGKYIALVAAGMTAALFMPVFYSRLGLRAIMLPVTAGLSAFFLWRWLLSISPSFRSALPGSQRPDSTFYWIYLLLAAAFAGLSSYTYMASRALPIFFAGFVVYLLLFHLKVIRESWKGWLMFGLLYLLLSLPLILFLQGTPGADFRVGEVDGPLRALLIGDPRPVLANTWAILRGFGWSGDPLERQNVMIQRGGPSRPAPIFGPINALLFYLGLFYSIWRLRDPKHGFLLIWVGAAIVPSVLTIDAPSTIRMILLLPILGGLPVLGLGVLIYVGIRMVSNRLHGTQGLFYQQLIHNYPQLSTDYGELSTAFSKKRWVFLLTILTILVSTFRTMTYSYVNWPASDEVQFVWQAAFDQIAQDLDQRIKNGEPQGGDAVIVGWSPDSLDFPSLQLVMSQERSVKLRHVGGVGAVSTMILPVDPFLIYRPTALPLDPHLETALSHILIDPEANRSDQFEVTYGRPIAMRQTVGEAVLDLGFVHPENNSLQLFLEGVSFIEEEPETLALITTWRVAGEDAGAAKNVRTFVHLVDGDGRLLSQHDGLDAPARFWQDGDTIIQIHRLSFHDAGQNLRIGLYLGGTPPNPRFLTADGQEFYTQPLVR